MIAALCLLAGAALGYLVGRTIALRQQVEAVRKIAARIDAQVSP